MSDVKTIPTVVWPGLRYKDAPAAIKFLVEAFGFEEVVTYSSQEGIVDHCELVWPGGGGVMLGSARESSVIKDLPAGTGSVYIVVDNPDEIHARAVAAGATIVRELVDEDYGNREFSCRDPEGVYWSFGTYAGHKAAGRS